MNAAVRSPPVPVAEVPLRRSSDVSTKNSKGRYHALVEEQQAKDILYLLLTLRFINALAIRTFFQPDEYFQSLEPAWQMAFGPQSGAWITWEWQHQLRSSLHPALFAVIYYVADTLMASLSMYPQFRAMILAYLPRVAQGVVAAAGDYYTWQLAEKIYGRGSNVAWTALLVTIFSPWQWFCSTRTLSNSLETVLTIAALNYWPWALYGDAGAAPSGSAGEVATKEATDESEGSQIFKSHADIKSLRICLFLAAIACLLRPTNLLIWFSLLTISFTRLGLTGTSPARFSDFLIILQQAVLCGSIALSISALSDRLYFGVWTFPPYQWLNFNINQDLAVFYGTNRWDYFITEGLPLLLTTYLPFALTALFTSTSLSSTLSTATSNIRFQLTFAVLVTISTLSLISHKEVRFIYPLLPALHILLAPHLLNFFFPPTPHSSNPRPISPTLPLRKLLLAALLTTNLALAAYTTLFHQRGVLSVLSFLRHDYESLALSARGLPLPSTSTEPFAVFLMPCHSTPWRSHLVHPTLRAWALTCEPPLSIPAGPERKAYRDEADRFYDDPAGFLDREVGRGERPWPPRYVVGFEGIEDVLRTWSEERMGRTVGRRWSAWNSHWHDDWRRRGRVVVWEFKEMEEEDDDEMGDW